MRTIEFVSFAFFSNSQIAEITKGSARALTIHMYMFLVMNILLVEMVDVNLLFAVTCAQQL